MVSLFQRKIGSILGLLAILMATLAPTVSHVLAGHERVDGLLATYCSANATPDDGATNQAPDHQAAFHWQACAYCGLLAHMPVLPSGKSNLVPVASATHEAEAIRLPQVRGVFPFTAAQPRAPPLSS
ncbi:DUF2946 domain-containing protein [Paraburkholderia sediminicola]|uniref:DUF2946 domain-containing protein n=1 Tax=Paraburkholderia sediminicola TaxID=458836 RepID=UPI0038B76DEC